MQPKFVLLAVLFGAIFPATQSLAHARPACESPSSDTDGDGYGWENNQTCIVDSQVRGSCEDRGGYPWGWNPVLLESCRLDVLAENEAATAGACIDTDPLNDGWGWDGVTSCVVPVEPDVYRCDDTGSAPWGWNPTVKTSCRLDLVNTPDPDLALRRLASISPGEIIDVPLSCKRAMWKTQWEIDPVFDRLEAEQDPSVIFFTMILKHASTAVSAVYPQSEVFSIEGSWGDIFWEQPIISWDMGSEVIDYSFEQDYPQYSGGTLTFYRVDDYIAIDQRYSNAISIVEYQTIYCVAL